MPDPARASAARSYLASLGVQVPTRVRRPARDVPGTLPGLAEAYATPAPLSAAEIEANAELARNREAERFNTEALAEGQRTSPSRIMRELGDIASMYGIPGAETVADFAAERGAEAGGDTSYDPVALGTAALPLADEAIGAVEHLRTGRPYREAQASAEQWADEAQRRSPGSALVGTLAQGAVAAPLAAEMTLARGAGAGGALGAAGGFLGSEGESGADRALATLRGGLTGGAYGATAGGLMQGGRLLGMQNAPGVFGRLGRSALGAGLEAEGAGIGMGALESGGRVGSEEQARDALRTVPSSFGLGAGLGLTTGALGAMARRRRAPGLADDVVDVAPTDLDETALLVDEAEDLAPSALTGTRSQRNADMQRIRAGGAIDRGIRNRLVRAFNPGNAERGLSEAARVARESGISPPGEFQTLDRTLENAIRARVRSGEELGSLYRQVEEGGGVFRGDAISRSLQPRIDRLSRLRSPTVAQQDELAALRARADDLRFGSRGMTPERAELERFRAAEPLDPADVERIPDDVAGLPGLDREVVGIRPADYERTGLRPQIIPFAEGRTMIDEAAGRLDLHKRGKSPLLGSDAALLEAEHRALVPERNVASRSVLGERYDTRMRPANETFRYASTVAPASELPNILLADPGLLTSRIAQAVAGGNLSPAGESQRLLERISRQFEPSINAMLAEHAASRAPSRLGDWASRLRLAAPSPAAAGIVMGGRTEPGMESQAATARAISELQRIAASRPRTPEEERAQEEANFALDTLGIEPMTDNPDEIDPLDMLGH